MTQHPMTQHLRTQHPAAVGGDLLPSEPGA